MVSIKDKVYNWLVKKNSNVQFEYEKYVMENINLHKKERFKHWLVLLRLCWHYRVLKRKPYVIHKNLDNQCMKKVDIGNKKITEKDARDKKLEKISSAKKESYPESSLVRINNRPTPVQLARKLMAYDVISFDIFDTLLYRPFDRPEDLFLLLGRKLDCMNFASIRKDAESRARDKAINRETDIYEIYEEFNKITCIDKARYINEEIEMEYNLCYVNDYMKRVFDILVLNNKDIILVSNMYLPEDTIKKMLKKCGIVGYNKLFISNVYKRNKAIGNLFSYVEDKYVKGRKVIHLGDNIELDVKRPRRYGWDSIHIPNSCAVARRYRGAKVDTIASSIYRGIVGNVTQNGLSIVEPYDKFWEFGFVYGGILAEGFCAYIDKVCKLNDIDRIIFLARDGDVVSKVYCKYYNTVSVAYMPWSRFLGSYVKVEKGIDELYSRSVAPIKGLVKGATVRDALIAMDCVFLTQYLSEYDLLETSKFDNVNEKKLYGLIKRHEGEILKYFEKFAEETTIFFEKYIADAHNVAVVDIGWTGGSIEAFRTFSKEKLGFSGKMIGITCGCFDRENVNVQISSGDLYAYLFAGDKNRDLMEKFTENNFNYTMIMETIFTAAVPSALEICNGRVRYGFPLVENYEMIRKTQEGILTFVKLFNGKFGRYRDLIDISPYDAYLPLAHFMSKRDWVEEQYKDYKFCPVSGFSEGQDIDGFTKNLKGEFK